MKLLDGKKSYLGALVVAVVAGLKFLGVLDAAQGELLIRFGEMMLGVGIAHKLSKMAK